MVVCALSERHLDQICRIEQAVFKQPWSAKAFSDILRDGLPSWVVENDGTVCGYLISLWVEGEVHILNVATDPEHSRRGVAARLLDHLYEQAADDQMKTVFLEVRVSNRAAIALYRKYGLGVLTVRKRYYGDGEDAYVMCGPVVRARNSADVSTEKDQGDEHGH